ncbi:MAG: hypothetical protein JXB04_13055 [Kiritimatiellae bacterium]|nr:hypothetical protein [Kiritimatiellia bacterium]
MKSSSVRCLLSALAGLVLAGTLAPAVAAPSVRRAISVNGTTFLVDGQPFLIKGMAYSPFYPGESNRDKIMKADVAKDMRQMRDIGINTLLVYWTRSERIYKEARRNGMMILHGIWIDQEPEDFHDERFKEGVRRQICHAIDYVHDLEGEDYSDTILGFWIGGELNPASVDGTDTRHPEIKQFKGVYYQTRQGASATECFLAEMCDYARGYAKDKYQHDFLFSHVNWPPTEPWLKLDFLDYILFDVYSFWPPEVAGFRRGSFAPTSYQGYIESLKEAYPRVPVIISEFGMSTAPDNVTNSGNNERDQAAEIVARWHDIVTTEKPLGGGIVFEWNDEWWKQSGAAVLVPFDADKNHHERDDAEEWFGIMSIDGASKVDYRVRPKPSYYAVQRMYDQGFYTGRRALQPIRIGLLDAEGRVALNAAGKPTDASRHLHLTCAVRGGPETMESRIRIESARTLADDGQPWGESLPLGRYTASGEAAGGGWKTVRIPLEHFGPLDLARLVSLSVVRDPPEPETEPAVGDAAPKPLPGSDLDIRDLRFSPGY